MERERKIVIRATYISYNSVTVIYFFSAKPVAGKNTTKQMIPVYLQMFFLFQFYIFFQGIHPSTSYTFVYDKTHLVTHKGVGTAAAKMCYE